MISSFFREIHIHATNPPPGIRRPLVICILIFLSLATASSVEAAMVRGKLMFSNGVPAAQIGVRVRTAKGVSPFAYSGRDGMYYLNAIPAGSYTLEVWRNGAMVYHQTIEVHEKITDVRMYTLQ
jgi:hypothetical protein